MNAVLRYVRINTWPIWFKLLGTFLIAAQIAMFAAFFVVLGEARVAAADTLEAYIEERGADQRQQISEKFENARFELSTFSEGPVYSGLILRALVVGVQGEIGPPEMVTYMNERLVGSGLFRSVAIVNSSGIVVASNTIETPEGPVPAFEIGMNLSRNQGFSGGQAARDLGDQQRLTLNPHTGGVDIYYTNVFRFDGTAIGYIIGEVNVTDSIQAELVGDNPFRGTYSYLATLDGGLIAPEGFLDQARLSVRVSPIRLAADQQAGTAHYTVGGSRYIGYYAPIPETPFLVITEAPLTGGGLTLGTMYRSGIAVVLVTALLGVVLALVLNQGIVPPLLELQTALDALGQDDFTRTVKAAERGDEIGAVARSFVNAREQLTLRIDDLSRRLTARIRDVQATQEVSRFAASQQDLTTLLESVVDLVVTLFPNIYHAQIFLIDDARENAVLRASTGEAGRQLLARGHRLGVGSLSVIGQVTEEGRVVLARDTASSEVHKRNEFLMDTRAELAIPLRFGDIIIGALDVQSKEGDSFTEDQVSILQTMADQIAIAIENARLYEESIHRLEELSISNQQATQDAWREYMLARRMRTLYSEAGNKSDVDYADLRRTVQEYGMTVVGDMTDRDTIPVAVPIQLRGQTLGVVEWEMPAADFDYDKVQLGQELANRLALSLDNARLFQESRSAINRERLVNDITARLTSQTTIDDILQTAVREVGQALRAPQVNIHLRSRGTSDPNQNGHNGA